MFMNDRMLALFCLHSRSSSVILNRAVACFLVTHNDKSQIWSVEMRVSAHSMVQCTGFAPHYNK